MSRLHHGTVSADFIAGMQDDVRRIVSAGNTAKLPTFVVSSPNGGKFPLKIKNAAGKPQEGETYFIAIAFKRAEKFQGADGKQYRSRDLYEVKLQTPKNDVMVSEGELRWETFPPKTEVAITPVPPFMQILDGQEERGVLWFASADVEYNVTNSAQRDEILFSGIATFELSSQEQLGGKRLHGGVHSHRSANDVTIYDRRRYHGNAPVKVEHVRRTLANGRTFEFMNVRDIPKEERPETVDHILSLAGLRAETRSFSAESASGTNNEDFVEVETAA